MWNIAGFFLGVFPVSGSVRKHRTFEFLSIFLEFFWWFSWVFGQICWVFNKIIEFLIKSCVYLRKNMSVGSYLHVCVALLPWKVKFALSKTQFLIYCNKSLSFCKKNCVKTPEHWVLHLKTLEFFSALEFFSPWVFAKTHKKEPAEASKLELID